MVITLWKDRAGILEHVQEIARAFPTKWAGELGACVVYVRVPGEGKYSGDRRLKGGETKMAESHA